MTKRVERIKIGKKMYSLNDIWRLCRKMWADIKDKPDICRAKIDWLKKQGFRKEIVLADCFFCEWAARQKDKDESNSVRCRFCPGRAVNRKFNCCNKSYHYRYEPKKFEAKIRTLDLKRKYRV